MRLPTKRKPVKLLFSLFDLTGNQSEPYRKAGWIVEQIDIQLGQDILKYDYVEVVERINPDYIGVIAAIPCTDYALSGSKHFALKDKDGSTKESNKLVERTRKIVRYCQDKGKLLFWIVENPKTRIHKLNPWLGQVQLVFHPSDFAGYSPEPWKDRYRKETWLFGVFKKPIPKPDTPYSKQSPIHKNFGGKSIKTKNARSETPKGFSNAFFQFNH